MTGPSPAFERTYRDYLARIGALDLASRARILGIDVEEGEARIPLLGDVYRVSSRGVRDPSGARPEHSVSVVLCQYLILCPGQPPGGGEDWVTYKDFRDAAPFVQGFTTNSEGAVARAFAGRPGDLRAACEDLGGADPGLEVSTQVASRFQVLPRIPLVLLFNDEDGEFGAECTLLFERRAARYLDMECLAILAWLLVDRLGQVRTIM